MPTRQLPGLLFRRAEVARILGITPATVKNREKSARYPEPRRDVITQWRVYTLSDVINLQLLTHRVIDPTRIAEVMYDKGYRDPKVVGQLIRQEINRKSGR